MANENGITRLETQVGDKVLSFETGELAKQAGGAVTISLGETIVFAACCQASKPKDTPPEFVPLSVDYREKTYAAGKIPGGFFKREGKARDKEILASRLTDRSVRPLFPDYFNTETQVNSIVISSDGKNEADVLSINAASAALMISDIPFNGPVGAVRIGKKNGKFVFFPQHEERPGLDMELVISGTSHGILMVEGGGKQIPNSDLISAMETAHPEIIKICNLQIELQKLAGKQKTPVAAPAINPELKSAVEEMSREPLKSLLASRPVKQVLEAGMSEIKEKASAAMAEKYPDDSTASYQAKTIVEDIIYEESRRLVLDTRLRVDGRKLDEIRPITIKTHYLPRPHGSALFTRGQTQSLATVTLGTTEDKQLIEDLEGKSEDRFMLHYNFPSFSTGEVRPDRGPGRREIGHGYLAKRALAPLIPPEDKFPYTIRVVSDIMESNGSSSMATVCGGSLSLFDAGVPMIAACSGIAMGLITDGEKHAVLSDIAGLEDHFGDMDFKLAGSRNGVTAFQMDVKLASGIPMDIMREAIEQATRGREHILGLMEQAMPEPRKEISRYAPRIAKLKLPKDKIGTFIGPGGKNIRGIIEKTGANIDVEEDGTVTVSSPDGDSLEAARSMVEQYTLEVEVGKVYKGRIVSIVDFGAFVEILPGKEGLLHISEIDVKRTNKVEDVLQMGQEVEVKVIEMENSGKFRLSRRALLKGGNSAPHGNSRRNGDFPPRNNRR